MSASNPTAITYKPMGITHVLISLFWALALVATNAIIFYFSKNLTSAEFFFIFLINAAIATPNAYFLSKLNATQTGISDTTTKA
jgi:hypothetical protein